MPADRTLLGSLSSSTRRPRATSEQTPLTARRASTFGGVGFVTTASITCWMTATWSSRERSTCWRVFAITKLMPSVDSLLMGNAGVRATARGAVGNSTEAARVLLYLAGARRAQAAVVWSDDAQPEFSSRSVTPPEHALRTGVKESKYCARARIEDADNPTALFASERPPRYCGTPSLDGDEYHRARTWTTKSRGSRSSAKRLTTSVAPRAICATQSPSGCNKSAPRISQIVAGSLRARRHGRPLAVELTVGVWLSPLYAHASLPRLRREHPAQPRQAECRGAGQLLPLPSLCACVDGQQGRPDRRPAHHSATTAKGLLGRRAREAASLHEQDQGVPA